MSVYSRNFKIFINPGLQTPSSLLISQLFMILIKTLNSGVHVVVGTPGRVFDMMKKGFLKAHYIRVFVLDDADEMLSRGFKTQI
jgi:predicted ATP-dependent endonuclease of OLD family